jgi:hypothetical protein
MSAAIMRSAPELALLSILGALAGCTHHPTITYPKLTEAGPIESGFDCAALDDAILKTEAVRWVMREDGARLISPEERAGRVSTDVATSVASCFVWLMCIPPVYLGEEGHVALDAADHRLLSLLRLKTDKGCVARPTAAVAMTDLELHDAVAALIAQEAQKSPPRPVGELRVERMRLLDQLRP